MSAWSKRFMNKVKARFITIISFFALLAVTLGLAIGSVVPAVRAGAATVYSPSSVFSAGTSGEVGASAKEGDDPSFVEFTLKDGGKVHFRRDLALKWYRAEKTEPAEGEESETPALPADPKGVAEYFSMTFQFPSVAFETFTIAFESAEENISKDAKATNSLVFEYAADKLTVAVKNAEQQGEDFEIEESMRHEIANAAGDISVAFAETEACKIGEFAVLVGGEEVGKFTNIGGYFMEYRSAASSTPNTPVTFTAELKEAEGETAQTEQKVLMKELNGQTFELDADGKVVDNADPVLVLNEELYAFSLGQRFNLTYEAIDVCDDSVTVSRSYYMYDSEKVSPSLGDTGDTHYKTLTTSTYFMPPNDKESEEEYVSVRFKLDDGPNIVYVNLCWYAVQDALEEMKGAEEKDGEETVEGRNFTYIKVNRVTGGPVYKGVTTNDEKQENETSEASSAAAEAYQTAVTKAAEGVSAGSGSYIYLPSLRGLVSSEYTDYRNLRFSVYYYKESQDSSASASSQTSLRYNALKLEVDQMGWYKFRVLVTDASNNALKLYDNGELVEVTSSNIWDFECIPEFSFYIDYDGATVEDPGEQSQGSRNGSYTFENFKIIALTGYETEYELYFFDTSKVPSGTKLPSYSSFVDNAKQYVEETYKDALVGIRTFNDEVEEDSAEWDDTDNDYKWNPDSALSFVPQKTGFYVLKVTVKDSGLPGYSTAGYQVVEVRNPVDTIPGQSQWLQDNVVSVVLFSISAVLGVIILVLLLVKPSDKSLDEVDLRKLKGGKKTEKKEK